MSNRIDYGPSVRQATDGRLFSIGAGQVFLEDREDHTRDPDHSGKRPVVRGARRRTALLDLYARGTLNQRDLRAALRFVDDLSLATGTSSRELVPSVASAAPWQRIPHQAQLDAMQRVRRLSGVLGLPSDRVFFWVVLEDRSMRSYEEFHRLRHGTAVHGLKQALEAVDRFYNPPVRSRFETS